MRPWGANHPDRLRLHGVPRHSRAGKCCAKLLRKRLYPSLSAACGGCAGRGCHIYHGWAAAPAPSVSSLGGNGADGMHSDTPHRGYHPLHREAPNRALFHRRRRIQPVHHRTALRPVAAGWPQRSGHHRKCGIPALYLHDKGSHRPVPRRSGTPRDPEISFPRLSPGGGRLEQRRLFPRRQRPWK